MSKYYSESAKQVRIFLKLPYVLGCPRIVKIIESEWIWIFKQPYPNSVSSGNFQS
jgi:hypothetical protein